LRLKRLLYTSLVLLMPLAIQASPLLIVGTPGNNNLDPVTGPSPNLGGLLIDFPLSQFPYNASGTTFNPSTYSSQGVTISSPDGLTVYPYSDQGPSPNFLYDDGTDGGFDGAANITIRLTAATNAIGVGIADSDDLSMTGKPNTPVSITLQALGVNGTDLGSAFTVTIPENTVNPGNGYFVLEDTTRDIYGLQIVAPTTDESGLAIADIQTAPEPSSLLLLIGGMAVIGAFRLRKNA
jgi:hypothetical protein